MAATEAKRAVSLGLGLEAVLELESLQIKFIKRQAAWINTITSRKAKADKPRATDTCSAYVYSVGAETKTDMTAHQASKC